MDINLDNLNIITQTKYKEFKEEVEKLLRTYKQTDPERFDLVKKKIEQTNGNWDISINLLSNNSIDNIDISQLLAYEYCLATERITNGKVSFESMLDKLFDGVQKFRIGNPVPGMDDECLYGKSFDDQTAVPVTSKLYRMIMPAGAQHLEYFKDNNFTGAVFIYEKGLIKNFAQDENGNPINMKTNGIDFNDLSKGQSLLNNLRQTVFHEWTHNSERDTINPVDNNIVYEYQGVDGKIYRNYEKVNSYVTFENINGIQEPQYIISTQKDSHGNRKRYFKDENGNLRPLSEVNFKLTKKQLETEYCFSTGLSTTEVMPSGETRIHNIITEGFVEQTARAMMKAIDPQVVDIDEEKYPEYVEMAKIIINSRDISLGENEQGQTYADFLMHSSLLKKDLESRTVVLDNGSKVDGLHYISDYADKVQNGQTKKSKFYKNMPNVAEKLNLSEAQISKVKESSLWQKRELSIDEQNNLKKLLMGENPNSEMYVDVVVAYFVSILKEESEFFSGIAEKLGYANRKSIQDVTDLSVLDETKQIKQKQERDLDD